MLCATSNLVYFTLRHIITLLQLLYAYDFSLCFGHKTYVVNIVGLTVHVRIHIQLQTLCMRLRHKIKPAKAVI